jgi:DNA-binding XRE family transcriptional regulator|tara:strand:- start:7 stop:252 length:246 start_codon:yes stop_codon:yes gene_type:complete
MEKLTPNEYKELRNEACLSQANLARELGVARETISRRENGHEVITIEASLAMKQVERESWLYLQECVDSGRETMAKLGVVV